jgi:HAD superfamily hydrolase (TIGR01457 family)
VCSYDALLLDLDGVTYLGDAPVPYAAEALDEARRHLTVTFVTNNASRRPDQVVDHLRSVGVAAAENEVVTSAQAAARILADRIPDGGRVLVLGADGLRQAVAEAGLTVVQHADEKPVAVAQGLDREQTYAQIAEAALAIRAGSLWVAANADATLPTDRGLLPGAGAFVAALRTATDAEPLIVGKPEPALHAEAVRRAGARNPLVVGDRLDTDIAGAVRAGAPSLLVLTGVTTPALLLAAPADRRPSYVGADLRALLVGQPAVHIAVDIAADGAAASCGRWRAEWGTRGFFLASAGGRTEAGRPAGDVFEGEAVDALRALCGVFWSIADLGRAGVSKAPIKPGDAEATAVLAALGLG